jgi:holo-[acyl-carrier protein] synthase
MIRGIGVDILEIGRIERIIGTHGAVFLNRVFTPAEIRYCSGKRNAAQHFAARFAAKEAVSKALATGLRGGFSWKDIEVMNDALGQPHIALSGTLKSALVNACVRVSLSHSDSHVVAMVVMEEEKS